MRQNIAVYLPIPPAFNPPVAETGNGGGDFISRSVYVQQKNRIKQKPILSRSRVVFGTSWFIDGRIHYQLIVKGTLLFECVVCKGFFSSVILYSQKEYALNSQNFSLVNELLN